MARPKQTDPQFKLRIPADLKERIERKAHANSRTLSAEILNLLEAHYPAPEYTHDRFLEEWIAPIYRANDMETMERLAEKADQFLKQYSPLIGVWVIKSKTDPQISTIRFGFKGDFRDLPMEEVAKVPGFLFPPYSESTE